MSKIKFFDKSYYDKPSLSLAVKTSFYVFCIIVGFSCFSNSAHADSGDKASPFEQGSYRATLILGRGKGFDHTYAIYGLGVAYYIKDGLEVGIDAEDWTGASPHIMRISPEIRYVFYGTPEFSPYAGLFYRRAYVSGENDIDSLGLRAGINFTLSKSFFIGIGMVYESALNCNGYCRDTYPEFLAAFVF